MPFRARSPSVLLFGLHLRDMKEQVPQTAKVNDTQLTRYICDLKTPEGACFVIM